jgi:hypothetical protein
MKVAISSSSFAAALGAGELTQLEWLEGCASALGADGVVFDRAHFPRTDAEYLAQLRKVAIDLGLVPLAVEDANLLSGDAAAASETVDIAVGIGALFALTALPPPGPVPPATFVATVDAAKAVVRAAKAGNITVLIEVVGGTLGADLAGLRHFRKDVDSAWVGLALPAAADQRELGSRDRALAAIVDARADLATIDQIDEAARPWFILRGDVDASRVAEFRRVAATRMLASANVS